MQEALRVMQLGRNQRNLHSSVASLEFQYTKLDRISSDLLLFPRPDPSVVDGFLEYDVLVRKIKVTRAMYTKLPCISTEQNQCRPQKHAPTTIRNRSSTSTSTHPRHLQLFLHLTFNRDEDLVHYSRAKFLQYKQPKVL